MKYKVILFDADETLFDFKKAEKEAFKNTMIEFNIDYDENYHFSTYKEVYMSYLSYIKTSTYFWVYFIYRVNIRFPPLVSLYFL